MPLPLDLKGQRVSRQAASRTQDLVTRAVPDVPRTAGDLVDIDQIADALAPCDVLESPPGVGWSTIIPHGGAQLIDDGCTSRLVQPGGEVVNLGSDPFDALDLVAGLLGATPTGRDPHRPAVVGGLVGAFAYDLARRVEDLPTIARLDRDHPHLHLRVADVVVAIAPDRDRVQIAASPGPWCAASPETLIDDLVTRLRTHLRRRPVPAAVGKAAFPATPQAVDSTLTRSQHRAATQAVLDAITSGEVFQVNLAQRLTARWTADVMALYRSLRAHSPAPYGAALPATGIASISPETFLAVDGPTVSSRPIKGTRPRSGRAALDAAMADDLATSVKDRAENVMVVDILRNDLGRVCRPGSVHVPQIAQLEAHPTVWHLVSTIEGTLDDQVGFGELLRATFPCGSITGAPKVAAMRLIERLEGVRRGWYCGAIGYLAPGAAHLSVAIRTAVLHADGWVDYGSGGGIVADSDPADEHAETLDKAAAFLRAMGATQLDARRRLATPVAEAGR